MDERVARIIRVIRSFEDLATFEANARQRDALSTDVHEAIKQRTAELGRVLIAQRTGHNLTNLSPAEAKIVEAVSEYVGVMKREGKDASRTFLQLRNRGLRGAAEAAVAKSRPTQGYQALVDADLSDLSYEQIVVDHPEEFSSRALWFARRTLGLENGDARPPAAEGIAQKPIRPRNPDWSRDELILALDLYLRFRTSPPGKTSAEVTELSSLLRHLAERAGLVVSATYRNANGVYMKMMNFRSIDPHYTVDGRVGLSANNDLERGVWQEFAGDSDRRSEAVELIRAGLSAGGPEVSSGGTYWVFVCNPKKWAIDRFLEQRIERDTWGVRPADTEKFSPGQLGIIRVGVDQRSAAERDGRPPLESGIYALCEVESTAFAGTGANGEFWSDGAGREPGWPTVKLRYLRSYLSNPLSISRLRREKPGLSKLLLDGFQAASFPITPDDFRSVMQLLGEDLDGLPCGDEKAEAPDELADLERRYIAASPEVKTRISKYIERGPVGAAVKRANGHKCQICEALGLHPIGFTKTNGDPYVEAHHVMPVSKGEVGSLSASNIMTVCANHHRQLHYGGVSVRVTNGAFELSINETPLSITRLPIAREPRDSG